MSAQNASLPWHCDGSGSCLPKWWHGANCVCTKREPAVYEEAWKEAIKRQEAIESRKLRAIAEKRIRDRLRWEEAEDERVREEQRQRELEKEEFKRYQDRLNRWKEQTKEREDALGYFAMGTVHTVARRQVVPARQVPWVDDRERSNP